MSDQYDTDYETEPIGGGNPYHRCVHCHRSVPEINGRLEKHEPWCKYRLRKENAKVPSLAIKVYLDDERPTPAGWVRTYWPEETIALLKTGQVEELSLDHDLGDDARGTGYTVLLWLEEAVATRELSPPRIKVHSANASARVKMELAIDRIARFYAEQ